MNKRFVGVLIFAFVVASGASLLLYRLLVNRPQQAKAAPAAARIVLAQRDIEVGTVLKEEDVHLADWPGTVPPGSSTKAEDVVGRGVITPIYAKEPIIDSRLAPKGAGGGLAAMIPPGMRAVAIRVNEVVGVAGFVVPGMRVDVLISGNRPGGSNTLGTVTKTLLQNIEVLSAGQDFKKDAEGKPILVQVVNLLVTPDAGRRAQPGEQSDQHPAGPAESDGSRSGARRPARRSPTCSPAPACEARKRPRLRPGRARPGPRWSANRAPPPKKETPFVMEIISGKTKAETKFDHSGEGK